MEKDLEGKGRGAVQENDERPCLGIYQPRGEKAVGCYFPLVVKTHLSIHLFANRLQITNVPPRLA